MRPVIVVAHRGASKAEQENTIAAFVRAGEMGADMVEFDVRRTADDAMVIHHDAEVTALGLIAAHARAILPDYIPDLADALDACEGMQVNVEIKSHPKEPDYDPTQKLAAMVVQLLLSRCDQDRMLISSFDLDTLTTVRSIAPQLRTGFLYTRPKPDPQAMFAELKRAGHEAIHPYHLGVNGTLVEQAHAAGLQVNTWTVDDPDRIIELRDWGVDAVITNVPDIARTTIAER